MADKRTYLVTGATGGIGASVAKLLCGDGHIVVLADVALPSAELLDQLGALAGEAEFIRCDIGDEAEVKATVDASVEIGGKLDGAVNCAGLEQSMTPLAELDLDIWNKVLRVNLTGMFLCMKHQIAAMLKSGGGSIVNIGSAIGSVGIANGSEYVASKHGVSGLTKAGALDYAKQGIRVNAVMPGVIRTPMHERHANDPWMKDFEALMHQAHPVGRMGQPIEVSEAVKWLLSDAASFVTGSLMAVDGGYTVS